MRILAFDQATRKSGVSYYENDELKYCGLLDCNNVYNSKERFHEMVKLLVGKIDEIQPDIVVFEDVDSSFGNVETIRLLAQMQGVIIGKCIESGIPYHIYKAQEWRSRLYFQQGRYVKRNELKKQALEWVKRHYGFDPQEDEAEAVCIGAAYWTEFGDKE